MDICKIYFIGFTAILMSALLLYLFIGKALGQKIGMFFSDILKDSENGKMKWSQGRFYLLVSLMFYFFVITLLSIKAVRPNTDIKNETFEMVISALQWIIALFAGYVFGAKGLKVLDNIFKYKTSSRSKSNVLSELGQETPIEQGSKLENEPQQLTQQDPTKENSAI